MATSNQTQRSPTKTHEWLSWSLSPSEHGHLSDDTFKGFKRPTRVSLKMVFLSSGSGNTEEAITTSRPAA